MPSTITCPVCGFPGLEAADDGGVPDFEYCPCCVFQFGVTDDDAGFSYEQWRAGWVSRGMPWEGEDIEPPPPAWNPQKQLDDLLRND